MLSLGRILKKIEDLEHRFENDDNGPATLLVIPNNGRFPSKTCGRFGNMIVYETGDKDNPPESWMTPEEIANTRAARLRQSCPP